MNIKAMRAADRVLKKLPAKTFDLTMPERGQLRGLEKQGIIRYNDEMERWELNARAPVIQDECSRGFHGACPNHLTRCDCSCHKA